MRGCGDDGDEDDKGDGGEVEEGGGGEMGLGEVREVVDRLGDRRQWP